MFPILVAIFVTVPLLELFILLQLAGMIGGWMTFGLVIVTGLAGGVLVRYAGMNTLGRIRRELERGRLPGDEIIDGLIILVGAAFLLTPGLLTDAAGLTTLFPPTRATWRRLIKRWFAKKWRVTAMGPMGMMGEMGTMGGMGEGKQAEPKPVGSDAGEMPPQPPRRDPGADPDAEFNEGVFEKFDREKQKFPEE